MVTPISFPSQQAFPAATPAKLPAGETAFIFNFNSPAISHGEITPNTSANGLSNGVGGNVSPATDTFQKKSELPPVADNNPFAQSASPLQPANPAPPTTFQAPEPPAPQAQAAPTSDPSQQFQQQLQAPAEQAAFDPMAQQQLLQQQVAQQQPTFANASVMQPPAYTPAAQPLPFGPPKMALPSSFPQPFGLPPSYAQAIQPLPVYPAPPVFAPPMPPPLPQMPPSLPQPGMNPFNPEPAATAPQPPAYAEVQNYANNPISDLNTMIAQPRTPDEKLAAINEIANRQEGDRQTYELLKQEISNPMQGVPPEAATAIRQAALIALGSLDGSKINARYAGNQLYGMDGIHKILSDKNENPLVKASAVAALGYMNRPQDKTIQELLKKAAKDNNPDVKNAVAQVQAGQMISPAQSPQAQ